jgi:hypothetical protein
MTEPLFPDSPLDAAIDALRADLIAASGPQISTMRNYRFAILPYRPAEEFRLRQRMRALTEELTREEGWRVLAISLQKLLLDRLRALGDDDVAGLIAREKRNYAKSPARALAHISEKITSHLEGADGIAADVSRLIGTFASPDADGGDRADRTLVLIGRAGPLYPFFRTSALLKHLDGKTRNVPVVFLYPGERRDQTGLSFMGELPADRDYRPRIYP